jgi:hypothetical protein
MSKRAPQFDFFGMPQERSQEPRGRLPEAHRCQAPGCTAWASYGLRETGIAGLRRECRWFCLAHRPETVSS